MKSYILSLVLLVNIVCGASDNPEAPFCQHVPPRITRINAQKPQRLGRANRNAGLVTPKPKSDVGQKKKYPLWLKIGVGAAVVTTTAIAGGLIWNKWHGIEFDGPYSYCLATAMNIGVVLEKLGVSNDQVLDKIAIKSHSVLLWGIGSGIYCVYNSAGNKEIFYKMFKRCFSLGLMGSDGTMPRANIRDI